MPMPNLYNISANDTIKVALKKGYFISRQKGSHIRMSHKEKDSITIPNHKIIGRGLLKKILRDANISVAELIKLIK